MQQPIESSRRRRRRHDAQRFWLTFSLFFCFVYLCVERFYVAFTLVKCCRIVFLLFSFICLLISLLQASAECSRNAACLRLAH